MRNAGKIYHWYKQITHRKGMSKKDWGPFLFSCSVLSDSLRPHGLQHASSIPNSRSMLKLMSIDAIQPSHPLSSPSPPAFNLSQHESIPMSRVFVSGGQSTGALASASVLPKNLHGWFCLGLTGLISMLSKGLSRVFSNTTVQKHQFFDAQPSLWSNSHIHICLLEKPEPWLDGPLLAI